MRTLNVAMGVVEQANEYLLQLRDSNPQKGAARLIGAFGGQCESGETPEFTCCRELREETSLKLKETNLTYLGQVQVVSDRDEEIVNVIAHVFWTELEASAQMRATEGTLVRIPKSSIRRQNAALTPATKACFEQLIKE